MFLVICVCCVMIEFWFEKKGLGIRVYSFVLGLVIDFWKDLEKLFDFRGFGFFCFI